MTKQVKDLQVITDPAQIKVLMEPTRSAIVFKYLIHGPMTVKQLADALGKNPGTILHHIEKLRKARLVIQVRTRKTPTGIIERYYRAVAREFRIGISEMMQADDKDLREFAENRLTAAIRGLSVFGLKIPESEIETAMSLLRPMIERENELSSNLPMRDVSAFERFPESVRNDIVRIVRRLILNEDEQYQKLQKAWHVFLRKHEGGINK